MVYELARINIGRTLKLLTILLLSILKFIQKSLVYILHHSETLHRLLKCTNFHLFFFDTNSFLLIIPRIYHMFFYMDVFSYI